MELKVNRKCVISGRSRRVFNRKFVNCEVGRRRLSAVPAASINMMMTETVWWESRVESWIRSPLPILNFFSGTQNQNHSSRQTVFKPYPHFESQGFFFSFFFFSVSENYLLTHSQLSATYLISLKFLSSLSSWLVKFHFILKCTDADIRGYICRLSTSSLHVSP